MHCFNVRHLPNATPTAMSFKDLDRCTVALIWSEEKTPPICLSKQSRLCPMLRRSQLPCQQKALKAHNISKGSQGPAGIIWLKIYCCLLFLASESQSKCAMQFYTFQMSRETGSTCTIGWIGWFWQWLAATNKCTFVAELDPMPNGHKQILVQAMHKPVDPGSQSQERDGTHQAVTIVHNNMYFFDADDLTRNSVNSGSLSAAGGTI